MMGIKPRMKKQSGHGGEKGIDVAFCILQITAPPFYGNYNR
jgi:hypothetical protein